MLFGFALTVLVRGWYWLVTGYFIGPVLGSTNFFPSRPSMVLYLAERLLTGLFVVATLVVCLGMMARPAWFRQVGHVFAWVLTVDTAIYLITFLWVAVFELDWGAGLLVPATAGNLILAGIAVTLIRWTRSP